MNDVELGIWWGRQGSDTMLRADGVFLTCEWEKRVFFLRPVRNAATVIYQAKVSIRK